MGVYKKNLLFAPGLFPGWCIGLIKRRGSGSIEMDVDLPRECGADASAGQGQYRGTSLERNSSPT